MDGAPPARAFFVALRRFAVRRWAPCRHRWIKGGKARVALACTVMRWRTAGRGRRVHGSNIAGNECCKVVLPALAAEHRNSPSCRDKFAASCCRLDLFNLLFVRSADRSDVNPSLRLARPTLSPGSQSRWMFSSVRFLAFDPWSGATRPRRRIFRTGEPSHKPCELASDHRLESVASLQTVLCMPVQVLKPR